MTIYLDVSAAAHRRAGLARYADSLTRALLQAAPEREFAVFYNRDRESMPLPGLEHVPTRTVRAGYKPWRTAVWLGQVTGLGMNHLVPDAILFHGLEHLLLPLRGVPTVLTVHDLIYRLFPAYHKRLNYWFLNLAMPVFCRRATAIITISESSKRDLMRTYGIPEERIHVTYEAAAPHFYPPGAARIIAARARYGLPECYVLAVGTIEPRKNLGRLLDAVLALRRDRSDLALVIIGAKGWLYEDFFRRVESLPDRDAVIVPGYIPDADLPAVMGGASVLALASLYEGFGLPILEAMACGTPVACSNTSSLPELGGDVVQYFDPYDSDAIAATLARILDDDALRADMSARGLARAAGFSWAKTARETLAVYDAVLATR